MKVRITNPGKPGYMTKISNAETGELLDLQVTEVTIKAKDDMPYAILTSIQPVVDIIADAEIKQVCPCCGRDVEQPKTLIEQVKEVEDQGLLD